MLDKISVVLIGTSHPGNIGSAARAMKVMGLTNLVLVDPACEIDEKSIALAAGAADVVANAKIVKTLDEAVADSAEYWEIPRMPIIDRCILRLATYELFYLIDIPAAVTINEAIELAKDFSTGESAKFINAILDKVKNLAEDMTQIEDLQTIEN